MLHLFTHFQALGKWEMLRMLAIDEVSLHLFLTIQSLSVGARAKSLDPIP